MARSSPGVRRVAAILNFMADHPGQSFALTDLVRALKLSRATCHALLTGLVEVGYLYRTSDKSYVLGPALARISRAVADHGSPMQVAPPEMRRLSDEYDVVCSAFFLEGQTITVRERASSVSHVGVSVPVGTRLKLRAPFAAIFFAWSPVAEVEAWLDAASPPPTAQQREALDKSMEFARRNGFVMFITNPSVAVSDRPVEQLFGEAMEFPTRPAFEIQPSETYEGVSFLAPVFDEQGKVVFALGLTGFNCSFSGNEAIQIAVRLRDACDRITGFIGGRSGGPAAAV